MTKFKKISGLILGLFVLAFPCFKISALEEEFEKPIRLNYLENADYDFNRQKAKKGFTFSLKFYRNKELKKDFKDEKEENFTINYADIVVRHLKKFTKEKFKIDDDYIKQIFQNYKINYDEDYFYVNFYVMPREEDFEQILKFCRNYLLEESFSSLFNKTYITENEFKIYVKDYFHVIDKKLKMFAKNIVNFYEKGNFKGIYELFSIFARDYAHSDDVFSTLTQCKRIKPVTENIVKLLKKIISENLKNNKNIDMYYYEDYDDYLCITENFADENYNRKIYSLNFNETETFKYLINNIRKFFKLCCLHVKKLKKIKFENFKYSLNNFTFGDDVKIIRKKLR